MWAIVFLGGVMMKRCYIWFYPREVGMNNNQYGEYHELPSRGINPLLFSQWHYLDHNNMSSS
jgi:hypothetical protein